MNELDMKPIATTHDWDDFAQDCVAEFVNTFGIGSRELLETLLEEELDELQEARNEFLENPTVSNLAAYLKESADVTYIGQQLTTLPERNNNFLISSAIAANAMEDALKIYMETSNYPGGPYAIRMEVMRLVHESNMSKLDEDGNVIRRADGKVLKSELYHEPDLTYLAMNLLIGDV